MFRAARLAGVGVAAFAGYTAFNSRSQAAVEAKFNPNSWQAYELKEKKRLSHNVHLLRFGLESPSEEAGMFTASCIVTKTPDPQDPSKDVIRPYTPTTRNDDKGYFDLVVKEYPQGKASKYICNLKVGDKLDVKGPYEKIKYQPNMKKYIGMVAGGSGITPMLQVIRTVLENPQDKTQISLLFANQTPQDIFLKDILDDFQKKHPDQFRVFYSVDRPNSLWKGLTGLPDKEKLTTVLPPPSKDSLVLVCGPDPMVGAIAGPKVEKQQGPLGGLLLDMGYPQDQVFKF